MITLDEYLASKSPEFRKEVDKQYSEMAMELSIQTSGGTANVSKGAS